ncbi:MAG: BolA protein [Halothiobacillaceae bacterium]|nr:MAG: BolA protein [Halothiobacillaceae bacterium]
MKRQGEIETLLRTAFKPSHLEVINESDQHSVPPGSESHFKVVMVSEAFDGQRLVARHQQVYRTLDAIVKQQIHALALHTYTPAEWQQRAAEAPASPACRGGSGK